MYVSFEPSVQCAGIGKGIGIVHRAHTSSLSRGPPSLRFNFSLLMQNQSIPMESGNFNPPSPSLDLASVLSSCSQRLLKCGLGHVANIKASACVKCSKTADCGASRPQCGLLAFAVAGHWSCPLFKCFHLLFKQLYRLPELLCSSCHQVDAPHFSLETKTPQD